MTISFIAVTVIYGILIVVASLLQLIKIKDNRYLAMFAGGCFLLTSVILWSMEKNNAWIGIAVGLVAIAIGAWINGGIKGKRNLLHHIICWILSIVLMAGAILL